MKKNNINNVVKVFKVVKNSCNVVVILDDGAGALPPNQAPPPLVVSRIYSHARAHNKKRSSSRLPAGRDGVRPKIHFFCSLLAENLCKDSSGVVLQARAANPPTCITLGRQSTTFLIFRRARMRKVVRCRPKVMTVGLIPRRP